jgi:hypothetical protein
MTKRSYKKPLDSLVSPRKTCGLSGATLLKSLRYYLYVCPNMADYIIEDEDGTKWLNVTQDWLVKHVRLSKSTVWRALKKLLQHGFIGVRGTDAAHMYCVLQVSKDVVKPMVNHVVKSMVNDMVTNTSKHVENIDKNDPSLPIILCYQNDHPYNAFLIPELRKWVNARESIPPAYLDEVLQKAQEDSQIWEDYMAQRRGVQTPEEGSKGMVNHVVKPMVNDMVNHVVNMWSKRPQNTYNKINFFSSLQEEKKNDRLLLQKLPSEISPAASADPVPQLCGSGARPAAPEEVAASVNEAEEAFTQLRCELKAVLGEVNYASWMENAVFFREPQGLIMRFASWFMADHVTTQFGQIILQSVVKAGEMGVLFVGPATDLARSKRPRAWLKPDGQNQPDAGASSDVVLKMKEHLVHLLKLPDTKT